MSWYALWFRALARYAKRCACLDSAAFQPLWAGRTPMSPLCSPFAALLQNFLALAASGAYDGTKFHRCAHELALAEQACGCSFHSGACRNIKGFIVQGGDPTGTGKGGKSVFDTYLEDEFHPELTVKRSCKLPAASAQTKVIGLALFSLLTIVLCTTCVRSARSAWRCIDGWQRSKHDRLSIFHHLRSTAALEQRVHCHRKVRALVNDALWSLPACIS